MSQALRWLLLVVAAFLLMPAVYEVLRALMPLILLLIGTFVVAKLILRMFKKW